MPAEWEPHAATWLAWPHNRDDWPGKFELIPPVFVEIARALAASETVRIIVDGPTREQEIRGLLAAGKVDTSQVEFFHAKTDRSWTRDFVPLFVRREREVAAVKFRFDGWARYDNHEQDDAAGRAVAAWRSMRGFEPTADDAGKTRSVVLEGGAIDVDGEGTLLASDECLLTGPHARNAWLGKAGTERVLDEYLGVEKVIWVGSGVAGDDTAGHVDDFVRFVAPGKILLSEETRATDPNYAPLAEARERLEGQRDAKGRKLEVLRVPMPAPVMWGDERLPASYSNYYVANGVVLVPVFDDPNDTRALGIVGECFPGRRIVPIRAVDLVLGLGTVHCSTHEEPSV
ncbi:MAG TPA: agmatine deiminase family protein [Polyangiaceae bacterium]|jgi:agmatine deiminase|nr:agmatine deiminase family protein [Polyangiaceae bacterium]